MIALVITALVALTARAVTIYDAAAPNRARLQQVKGASPLSRPPKAHTKKQITLVFIAIERTCRGIVILLSCFSSLVS